MNIWYFKPNPPTKAALDVFVAQSVVAIGWPNANRDDTAGWRHSYPLNRDNIWSKCEPSKNKNKRTPQAASSFEHLLCDTRPGDLIVAFVENGGVVRPIGVGVIGAKVGYRYRDDLVTPTAGRGNLQPHALEGVVWKSNRELESSLGKIMDAFTGLPGIHRGPSALAAALLKIDQIGSALRSVMPAYSELAVGSPASSVHSEVVRAAPGGSAPDGGSLGGEELLPTERTEGNSVQVFINRYERDPKARAECLRVKGTRCSVCETDFERAYGAIGRGFIHVHHLVPLASIKQSYVVDPLADLVPVCPNCHAMLHRRRPMPYSIKELRNMIGK